MWQQYWSFSFSISPSNEYLGLISFRMDWLDLLAVQGTLKSLLQHHSSKASILWCLAFFMVQLSHPYMTNGKTIALTRQTFVGKVMSLLFIFFSFIYLFYFTILYWFCHTSTWIHHRCTCAPHADLPLPCPSPYHPSESSQCTSPKHPVSCIEPGLAIRFIYDIIHVSMPFSQIIPPPLSCRVQMTVLYICVSFAVSHTELSLPSF